MLFVVSFVFELLVLTVRMFVVDVVVVVVVALLSQQQQVLLHCL